MQASRLPKEDTDGDEASEWEAWGNEFKDSMLRQVHAALDAYERSSQEHISAVLALEEAQRSNAIANAVSQSREAFENRIKALEDLAGDISSGSHPSAAGIKLDPTLDVRLQAIEARPGPMEMRIAALEAAERNQAQGGDHPNREPTSTPMQPPEEIVTSAALDASSARLLAAIRAVEGDIMVLQGELVMFQARTQVQGVSGSIFSLRAADMDERSRGRSIEVLVKKEAEVARILDKARQAKDVGGMPEVLARLGMRIGRSQATGDPQVLNFSLAGGYPAQSI